MESELISDSADRQTNHVIEGKPSHAHHPPCAAGGLWQLQVRPHSADEFLSLKLSFFRYCGVWAVRVTLLNQSWSAVRFPRPLSHTYWLCHTMWFMVKHNSRWLPALPRIPVRWVLGHTEGTTVRTHFSLFPATRSHHNIAFSMTMFAFFLLRNRE